MKTLDFTTEKLMPWEKEIFQKPQFKEIIKCLSLQLKSNHHEEILETLARQTGFRKEFILEHLEEIKDAG